MNCRCFRFHLSSGSFDVMLPLEMTADDIDDLESLLPIITRSLRRQHPRGTEAAPTYEPPEAYEQPPPVEVPAAAPDDEAPDWPF
jgi:hypothetical protein